MYNSDDEIGGDEELVTSLALLIEVVVRVFGFLYKYWDEVLASYYWYTILLIIVIITKYWLFIHEFCYYYEVLAYYYWYTN